MDVDKNTKTALGVQVDAGKVANNAEKKQMVLSISMRDLMRLKQLEKDQNESNPLHRDDTIYAAKDVREQIQFMEQQKKSKKSRRNEEEEDEDNHEEEEEEEEVIRSASKKKRRAK